MAIVNTTDAVFQDTIKEGLVLVDFWAPWCGPCKIIAPILEELSGKVGDAVTIAKVNVDDNPESAGQYGIMSIPTLKIFKDGVDVATYVGVRPLAELEAAVRQHLS
ncbi:thioredoxin [Paenibacillus hemerocallicola]|jgi:thioredoxin 1|uniref:Thioredoxin n=1 Tax=Paenibacillus hemerocallicola TaxID=1172614 RepID=A0A5C4T567_9BACL|nr:thioredoxin [Paenibacillus hemerocallicola]TNJ63860.1 thioredoxin [Paenibacillus hemerocallicola]